MLGVVPRRHHRRTFGIFTDESLGDIGNPLPASGTATITGGTLPTPSSGSGGTGACSYSFLFGCELRTDDDYACAIASAYRTTSVGAVNILVTSALALVATAFTLMA